MSYIVIGTAVYGLGSSIWDRVNQDAANKKLVSESRAQKGKMASAKASVGGALEGELQLASVRQEEQKDFLTEKMSGELKTKMSQIHDSKSTFKSSYRDTAAAKDVEQTVWQGYEKDAYGIDVSTENQKIGAYSNAFSSVSDMDRQMSEIEAQINQLS